MRGLLLVGMFGVGCYTEPRGTVIVGFAPDAGAGAGSGSAGTMLDAGMTPEGADAAIAQQPAPVDAGPPPTPPSVSLAASSYSSSPDASGAYAYMTALSITAAVSGADSCERIAVAPGTHGWTGTVSASFDTPLRVTLGAPGESYAFRMTCSNAYGTTTSNTISVTTNCAGIAPAGFQRAAIPRTWPDFQGAEYPDKDLSKALVPVSVYSNLTFLGASRGEYTAIEFTTPEVNPKSNISTGVSQIPGTYPAYEGVGIYFTLSRCPGDFRYAIVNPQVPTEAQTCKSVRRRWSIGDDQSVLGIGYNQTGISGDPYRPPYTNNQCGLEPGKRYYLNYINRTPRMAFKSASTRARTTGRRAASRCSTSSRQRRGRSASNTRADQRVGHGCAALSSFVRCSRATAAWRRTQL